MCYALFIATEKPIQLISWNKQEPGFYIIDLSEREETVKTQFSKPNIYYAGSHQRCGCGFVYDNLSPDAKDAFTKNELSKQSVRDLVEFLNNELQKGNELELFFCWEGNENSEPRYNIEMMPTELIASRFPLKESTFVKIIRGLRLTTS